MAKIGVTYQLDVKKIDKARLYAGQKGTYLNFTTFIDIDQKDQYDNNGMITQDVSKEERDSGVKGVILGNCKVFWHDNTQAQQPEQPKYVQQAGRATRQEVTAQQAPQQQSYPRQFDQQPKPQQQAPQPAPQAAAPDMGAFDDDIPFN